MVELIRTNNYMHRAGYVIQQKFGKQWKTLKREDGLGEFDTLEEAQSRLHEFRWFDKLLTRPPQYRIVKRTVEEEYTVVE